MPTLTHNDNSSINPNLSKKERYQIRKQIKLQKKQTLKQKIKIKKILKKITWIIIILSILTLFIWLSKKQTISPPTTTKGHIENSPSSHILDQPMGYQIQQHMLEHADGNGKPGVIINYNCKNFNCSQNLIPQLTQIAQQYPSFVYLAPYPNMSSKITLTRLNKIKSFTEFNQQEIIDFITNK